MSLTKKNASGTLVLSKIPKQLGQDRSHTKKPSVASASQASEQSPAQPEEEKPKRSLHWPFPAERCPAPTRSTLKNILHAIAAIPALYTQVLHAMIRMGLPPPFGPVTSIPLELCTGGKGKVKRRRDELLASDESEMESDNEDMKPKTKRAKLAAPPIQSNVPFPISLYGRPCVSNSTLLSFESDNTAPRQQHIHRQNMPLSNSTARKAPVARVPLFRPYQFSNRPFVYPTPSEAGPPGVYAAPPPRNFTNPSFFKPPPFLSVRPPSAIEPAPPGTSPCLPTPGTTRTRSETARLTTPSILNPLIYAPMPPGVGYRPNFPRFRPPPTHAPAPIVIFHTPSSRPPDLPNMNRPQLVGRAVPSQTANGTSIETTAASKSVQKAVDTMKNGESEANAPIERARMSIEEILKLPSFSRYSPGEPSPVLYIKNLHSKKIRQEDLESLFKQYFGLHPMDIKVMKEGRMRGQAFVRFPSVDMAVKALKETNGYILYEKPMIIQFGKGTTS